MDENKTILANIMTNLGKTTSLSEQFMELVLKRLVSFGYTPTEDDSWVICFAAQKVENHIKNSCNTTVIPEGLFHVAVDCICGEFLFSKKQTGKLEIADLDLTGVIKQISEGDVSVSFSDLSDEQRFNQLLNHMMTIKEGDLSCFRKLKW